MAKRKDEELPQGFVSRIYITIAGSIVTLICLLLFLAFFSAGFTDFQMIAIVTLVLLILAAVLGGLWGIKFAEKGDRWEKQFIEECPFCSMSPKAEIASKLVGAVMLSAVIIYQAFYATGFTLMQNLAIIVVAFLLWGAVQGSLHTRSCMDHPRPRKPVRKKKKRK